MWIWNYIIQIHLSNVSRVRHHELFVRFYLQALTLVAGTDTFQTFLMKLKAMDAAEFKSQFTLLLEEEMLARGMSLN